jgi:hypothetical protein
VFLATSDDRDTHFRAWMRQQVPARSGVDLPIAAVVRVPEFRYALGPNQAWRHDHLFHDIVDEPGDVDGYRAQPVELGYNAYLYEQRMDDIELTVNALFVAGLKTPQVRHYTSFLGVRMAMSPTFAPPSHDALASAADVTGSFDELYRLLLPVMVAAVLLPPAGPVRPIPRADLDLHPRPGRGRARVGDPDDPGRT